MSIWSVIGSRCLPCSWESRVGEVVAALLIRNCALVRASVGVVAFVSGCSAGSWFTVGQAIRRDLAVVVFSVDGPSGLHHFVGGSWVPCRSLAGAYVFTYFEKE
jgi:hypothetical protein